MPESSIIIRAADPSEFDTASEFWVSMRRELDMPDADLALDWKARSIAYFTRRHDAGELRWFLARDGEVVVASAAGFLLDGYPSEICINRKVGYVAGVFVMPKYRRRGLARAVTQAAIDWLWQIGCRLVRLHSANEARAIYESMGFEPSNEMIIERPTGSAPALPHRQEG
ncbi:MAG: GNAT family N-acetyltransferase [Candidatus Eremiobacteraeota bacterium]|nr:GNAT family N-acetyltransferase [Candidatus Eremiobacteraeota bacterium]